MKNEYYVAAVVSAYKELVDDYMAGHFSYDKARQLRERLKEVFSRGEFTEGYLKLSSRESSEIAKAALISAGKQGHAGVKLGTVISAGKGTVKIRLEINLNAGDELTVMSRGSEIRLTSNTDAKEGTVVTLNAPMTKSIRQGTEVRRLKNAVITRETEELLETRPRIEVDAKVTLRQGQPVTLSYNGVTVTGPTADPASKNPVTDEVLKKAAGRLGDTDFILRNFTADNDGQSFIPVSALNDMRRAAVAKLEKMGNGDGGQVVKMGNNLRPRVVKMGNNLRPQLFNRVFISVSYVDQMDALTEYLAQNPIEDPVIMVDLGFGMEPEQAEGLLEELKEKSFTTGLMMPHNHSLAEGSVYRRLPDQVDIIYIRNIDDYAVIKKMTESRVDMSSAIGKAHQMSVTSPKEARKMATGIRTTS